MALRVVALKTKLSFGVHRVATFTDQTTNPQAKLASTQMLRLGKPKVSLASCTPVQQKEKCSISTCSPGYAITVVTVCCLQAVTIHIRFVTALAICSVEVLQNLEC